MGNKCINCIYYAKGSNILGFEFFCRKIYVYFNRKRLNRFNSCSEFKARNDYDLILPKEINR